MRRELKANPRLEVCPPLSKDFTSNLFLDVNSGTLNHDHFKGVNVLYANIDSLLNKREELKTLILVKDPDIIILTEILPKNCGLLSLSEFEIDGFELFTPSIIHGRGVAIYCKIVLSVNIVDTITCEDFQESIWCRVKLRNSDSLIIGCIYRSPSSDSVNNDKLNMLLKKVIDFNDSHILIVGDFNYKDIDWPSRQSNTRCESDTSKFIESINDCYFYQHVLEPTRYRDGQHPSILDLILTNEELMINDIEYMAPIGKSDHIALFFKYTCYVDDKPVNTEPKYQYHKGDYVKLKDNIDNVHWNETTEMDIEQHWDFFTSNIISAMDHHIPKSKPGMKRKKKWVTGKAATAIQDKKKAWKKYTYCKTKEHYSAYVNKRNQCTGEVRRAKKDFERKLIQNVKEDAKSFWSYIRSKTKTKSTIGDIEDNDGVLTSDCLGKAEILNSFFGSVFVNEDASEVPELPVRVFNEELKDIVVTPEIVQKQLLKLNSTKSPGDDQMHPRVLKELNSEICDPLAELFNKTITQGRLPSQWKYAIVVPLFKKGNKKKAENYRPVSLTSVVCKVLESLIRTFMMEHMETNSLFVKHQHGFRPGHSCVTQLLEVTDEWFDILDRGGNIDCIYLDFRKAFDTVPHLRLSNKLYSYGIRGTVRTWIENFLCDRNQSVRVESSMSPKVGVTSGIPQGSVLGPILFLIFINDLPEIVTSAVKLFADDTKLYREISSESDCDLVQNDLNGLSHWTDTWLLRFNASKCKSMHFGRSNKKHKYHIQDGDSEINVEQISLEKDIGVNFDEELKFSQHIAICVKKANQKLGLIRRSFDYMDRDMFLTLFKTLIRPTLEYASVIWSPFLKKDIVALENVQRRATKIVKEISSLSYEERLKNLGLPTLIYRRERADMVQLFKIMNGFDKAELSIKVVTESVTRGHQHKIEKRRYNYKSHMNTFTARSVNPWNSLPTKCIEAKTVNSFKSGLNEEWKRKPNKFYYNF